jgi:hypothetical protein
MTEFKHRTCWTQERADAVLRSVALGSAEAEFLAVHQPFRGFHISSTTGQNIDPSDEALLANLSDPQQRYAFCVVEGEPGAGKSHLIRWLKVKWRGDDLVMLIERADGSLTGTLRQLRDQLGPRYEHLFENLSQSVEASFEGRIKLFHANLAISLGSTFFETPIGDESWCATWDVERLIGNQTVQEKWRGPERILRVMSGDGGQRNSASARFNLYDICDLARVQTAAEGLPPRALMLMRALSNECARIGPARASGTAASDLELDEQLDIPQARKLLNALNTRRNFAVQHILGISADGLRDMFFKLRKELLNEQRRLVLLLEDVTSWEGIDGQLIDSLVVDARARNDVCDMISVVGMTPLYFRGIQGNYGGRITHILRLGRMRQSGGFQETIQLATTDSKVEFAARYLRAVRIGRAELEQWHRVGANPDLVPNQCSTCPERLACFAAFGESGGIGLFPFNRSAISKAFDSLEDPKGTQSLQTPRGMIQGVLSPVLQHPSRFDAGEFPPVEIELSEWMPERALQPSSYMAQVIDSAEPDPERRSQLVRLMMLWGEGTDSVSVSTSGGIDAVCGVTRGIFEAFRLPWLGQGLERSPPPPPPDVQDNPAGEGGSRPQVPVAPPEGGRAEPPRPVTPALAPPRPTLSPPAVSVARLKALAEQARQWRQGQTITNPVAWETLLMDLMVEVRELLPDCPAFLWDRIFTKDTVKLDGLGRTDSRHFVIPREDWATRGLEAYLSIRLATVVNITQMESDRRATARLLRRLAELVSAQIARRTAQEEGSWSVERVTTQVLMARMWLRGAALPDAPLEEQFQELLSDEQEPRSLPDFRVVSWGEVLKASNYWHDKLRAMLRQSLALPLGTGTPLINAGAVADAMKNLRDTMRLERLGDHLEFSRGLEELGKLVELVKETDSQLRHIPEREIKSLSQRKARALVLLRQSSLRHHLGRVGKVLSDVVSELPNAAAIEIEEYRLAHRRAAELGLLDEANPAWSALRDYLLDDDAPPGTSASGFSRAVQAPVYSLKVAVEALEKAENAIIETYKHARACVESDQSDGDLSIVSDFGKRLASAAGDLQSKLYETP